MKEWVRSVKEAGEEIDVPERIWNPEKEHAASF